MNRKVRAVILSVVVATFITSSASGQLKVNSTGKLKPDTLSVKQFIKQNNLSYALVAWSTSNWFSLTDSYYLLAKQGGKSYLALIKSDYKGNIEHENVTSRLLATNEAASIMSVLQPDVNFLYSQEQFDKLENGCKHVEDGVVFIGKISDGGYFNLLQYTHSGFHTIKAYAPEFHLENCLQYDPAFGILKGLVNTYRKLQEAAVRLK